MTAQSRVLVADGDNRAALAIVRSLARAGHTVCVASSRRQSLAGASRYARYRDVVADPITLPWQFVDDIAQLIRHRRIDVLIPVTDAALVSLSRERARLGPACFPWPDADTVSRVTNKAELTAAAGELGIAVPRQRIVVSPEDAVAAARELRFPLVLKPSRSVREAAAGSLAKLVVGHAANADELSVRVAEVGGRSFPLLLQERVVGPGVGVSLLVWDGRTIAHFTHRRLREHPPAGGVSVYAESIPPDPSLVARSVALLDHFAWRGVAMVEYKLDAATGTPYIMEVNGRFWGSLQLAIDAGVDFPVLLLSAAHGTSTPVAEYRSGVRMRWWWGDVDHLLLRVMHSPTRLSLPPGAPSRVRAVRDFFSAGSPYRASDVFRSDDPRPFVVETAHWLTRRAALAVRRVVGR